MVASSALKTLVIVVGLLALTVLAGPQLAAQTMERRADPMEGAEIRPGLFLEKCGSCHKRAAPLVFEQMSLSDGVLITAEKGQDLRVFLQRHYRRPKDDEIAAIYTALVGIAQGMGRFKTRCGICHESAEQVTRDFLIRRDRHLFGRYSGRDIEAFLQRHGTDGPEEAAFFYSVLKRQPVAKP